METKKRTGLVGQAVILAFIAGIILFGCARKGPILVDFNYQPPREYRPETAKAIVAVSPFKDEREKTASVAGRRLSTLNDRVDDFVVQGTVSDKVTATLKNALKARGITTTDVAEWDLTDSGIPSAAAGLLISGEIRTLWAETISSGFGNAKFKVNVDLRITAADVAQKKIIRILNVNSSVERQNVVYSTTLVQTMLSEAVSTALNQIFNDEELKNRLK